MCNTCTWPLASHCDEGKCVFMSLQTTCIKYCIIITIISFKCCYYINDVLSCFEPINSVLVPITEVVFLSLQAELNREHNKSNAKKKIVSKKG